MEKRFNLEDHKYLRHNPFAVPENYFSALPSSISFLKSLPKEEGFLVPQGYFEQLPEQLRAAIAVDQLGQMKKDPHAIPEGYFDSLGDRIKARIREEEGSTKIISIRSSTHTYWAVAAGMALMIGLSSLFFYLNDKSSTTGSDLLFSEESRTMVIENPEQFNIDESALLEEMGVNMEENADESEAEELLLESSEEMGSEIIETE